MGLLVTGGAGFIGSNFVHHWLKNNDEWIINLDKLTYAGNPENISSLKNDPRHIFVKVDINDSPLIADLLAKHSPRAIINFAAESHVDRSIYGPDAFIQTNIMGTFQLLKSALTYWRNLPELYKENGKTHPTQDTFYFIHVSTDEVYGSLQPDDPAFTEENNYKPNSPYSASKASSDHLVRSYYHTYGLPAIITNCSNNYGPYQFPEKLIPLMIQNALTGKQLPIYGDGQHIRDWLYVIDHCKAICRVLKAGQPGEVYNIGGFNEKTNLEIVHTLCDLLDKKCPLSGEQSYRNQMAFIKDRPGHDRRYAINSNKIKQELHWMPEETLETGLEKTVKWYLDNQKWVKNTVTHNSYQSWMDTQYT